MRLARNAFLSAWGRVAFEKAGCSTGLHSCAEQRLQPEYYFITAARKGLRNHDETLEELIVKGAAHS